jgi:hypothetical protein
MKLSDLKVGEKLGISVYLLKVIRIIGVNHPITYILEDKDGHINDIISNITETYIEFGVIKWRVDISLLYEKGVLEKEVQFEVPEKWYIKRHLDNYEVVNNWFNNNAGHKKKHSSVTGILFYPNCSTSTFQEALQQGYKEITFEEFKEYVLNKKQQKVMFTKQDWIERKCVIKFEANKREITSKFLKECNAENSVYGGTKKYIFSNTVKKGFWNCDDYIPEGLPIVTIDELLNPNNMVENKKIVGYKTIGNLVLTKEETEAASEGKLIINKSLHPEAFEPIYEENLELGGYKLEFTKTTMKFDGATFKKAELEILEEVLEDNSNIHITLKSIPVDLEMLKKIIKNFK